MIILLVFIFFEKKIQNFKILNNGLEIRLEHNVKETFEIRFKSEW